MGLIASLIEAAKFALRIWATKSRYALTKEIEADIEAMEAERDRLRNLGDAASQHRADLLQSRILRAQGIAVPEPAARPSPQSGPANSNG